MSLVRTNSSRCASASAITSGLLWRDSNQERADPREIEGRQALFVVNLEPRKMRGGLSEGMLFDIGYADGVRPVLSVPESPVPGGSAQADPVALNHLEHRETGTILWTAWKKQIVTANATK